MPRFDISVTLADTVTAADSDAAFGLILDAVANRDGMEIVSHSITEADAD